MEDINKYKCEFTKNYDEPSEKYVVVSFSIFYVDRYIRHTRNKTKNLSTSKQLDFLYNLTINIYYLDYGFLPSNWYFRIYYDESIFEFKHNDEYPWKKFINYYKNHKRLQFVKYKCPAFMQDNRHINLFGMLIRLYPLFSPEENTSLVILFDADNVFSGPYLNDIKNFIASNYDYNVLSSKFEVSYYIFDFYSSDNNYYMRMNKLASKKKFKKEYWNFILYQLIEFTDKPFNDLVETLYKLHLNIRPDRKITSYKNFEYGTDEIVLNYYVKKIFDLYKYKPQIVRYSQNILYIYNTLEVYLRFNLNTNKTIVNKIINAVVKKISKQYSLNNFEKNTKIINNVLYLFTKNKNQDYTILFNNYIKPIRNNIDDLEKLFLPNNVIKFFKYANEKDFNLLSSDEYFPNLKLPSYIFKSCELKLNNI